MTPFEDCRAGRVRGVWPVSIHGTPNTVRAINSMNLEHSAVLCFASFSQIHEIKPNNLHLFEEAGIKFHYKIVFHSLHILHMVYFKLFHLLHLSL